MGSGVGVGTGAAGSGVVCLLPDCASTVIMHSARTATVVSSRYFMGMEL
jgi:hypothetical protein